MACTESDLAALESWWLVQIFFYIEVLLIYSVVLISAVQQSDLVIHICILFHYGLSWDTDYSFLCYIVGPCCPSILYVVVRIFPGGASGKEPTCQCRRCKR